MHRGYIKAYRAFEDWCLYKDSESFHLLMHLIFKATHKEKKIIFEGKPFALQPGQFTTGLYKLSQETGISEQRIRTRLKKLEKCGEIKQKSTNKCTLITLLKWEQFQSDDEKLTNEQQTTNKQLTNEQQLNKNDKNVKNDKNKIYSQFEAAFFDKWNAFCARYPTCKAVTSINQTRRAKLKVRFSESNFRKHVDAVFSKIEISDFLKGKNDRGWVVSFDWLIKNDTNYLNILEDKYANKEKSIEQIAQEHGVKI